MEVIFRQNIVHGPVLVKNKHNNIQAFGYYHNGQAHGPFWLIYETSTFLQLHFCQGHLVEENVILVDADTRHVKIGTLQNGGGGSYLKNVERMLEIKTGKYLATIAVKIPPNRSQRLMHVNNNNNNQSQGEMSFMEEKPCSTYEENVKLPIKIMAIQSKQRLMIRPSRIMYFNRVAKTGTLNMLMLMKSLGVNLGYDVDLGFRLDGTPEILQDDSDGLRKEVDSLVQIHKDTIKARHYSFFDIRAWGHDWFPEWFSIVRDPIERVRCKK